MSCHAVYRAIGPVESHSHKTAKRPPTLKVGNVFGWFSVGACASSPVLPLPYRFLAFLNRLLRAWQALLLALGIKAKRLGAAAAMSWVLKDALGKFGRILWASKMGRRFDSDAKRWRFRSRFVLCLRVHVCVCMCVCCAGPCIAGACPLCSIEALKPWSARRTWALACQSHAVE